MVKYYLMHKNDICGELVYDEKRGVVHSYKDKNTGISPFLGNCDSDKILDWWKIRSIPASRNMVQDILQKAGCDSTSNFLAKNLALSMTDSYWICPMDFTLKYEDIQFKNFVEYNEGKIPYHNATSYDPNASLGGQMEKYWDLQQNTPILVKESSKYFGQQSINEVFATYIHKSQDSNIPYVAYTAMYTDMGSVLSKCPSFTSENIEFIPAYEIVSSTKNSNNIALYDKYIDVCVSNGIDRDVMQDYMDYLVLSDFVISNTDEHLLNFGVLRNADTMELIGPAPIFDSGNSMFFSDERKKPYTRIEILERKITSFYESEEKMLAKVKNKRILKEDLLPSPQEVKEIYLKSRIPEWKADVISQNYHIKLDFLHEFQHGKKISLYQEKREERNQLYSAKVQNNTNKKFIMMCGIPGSGKTELAKQICLDLQEKGHQIKDARILFPIKELTNAFGIVLNEEVLFEKEIKLPEYKNSVVYISANDIRDELQAHKMYPDHEMIFTVASLRVKSGLANDAIVVFDASNIEKENRIKFLELAKAEKSNNNELYVINCDTPSKHTNIPEEVWNVLKERWEDNYPSLSEGWSNVKEFVKEPIRIHKEQEHELSKY